MAGKTAKRLGFKFALPKIHLFRRAFFYCLIFFADELEKNPKRPNLVSSNEFETKAKRKGRGMTWLGIQGCYQVFSQDVVRVLRLDILSYF